MTKVIIYPEETLDSYTKRIRPRLDAEHHNKPTHLGKNKVKSHHPQLPSVTPIKGAKPTQVY